MKRNLLEIYALAVCFFTVACFVVVAGIGIYDIVQIADPEFTLNSYLYDQYQSNDEYRRHQAAADQRLETLSEDELTKHREAAYARALKSERHDGQQSLLRMLIIMLVDTIAFVIHWRLAKRVRESGA